MTWFTGPTAPGFLVVLVAFYFLAAACLYVYEMRAAGRKGKR